MYFSLQYLSLSDAVVLKYIAPILTGFSGAIFLKESLSLKGIAAGRERFHERTAFSWYLGGGDSVQPFWSYFDCQASVSLWGPTGESVGCRCIREKDDLCNVRRALSLLQKLGSSSFIGRLLSASWDQPVAVGPVHACAVLTRLSPLVSPRYTPPCTWKASTCTTHSLFLLFVLYIRFPNRVCCAPLGLLRF